MTSKPRILVLGGNGFIGRHAVAALKGLGHHLVVGTRKPTPARGGNLQQRFRFEEMASADAWQPAAEAFDVILNCVGILRPVRAATYERVHHLAPAAIARACGKAGTRFIHVSALGLSHGDRSGFLTSKRRGEAAIHASGCNWLIARPSLLDGEGGYGAAWLRGVSRLPVFAVPADAKGRIAALTVIDLGEALARLCVATAEDLRLHESRTFELGGVQSFEFAAYIHGLRRRYTARRALGIPIPGIAARLGAHLCDLFNVTPFSFGHWELLRKDNVPSPNRLPELLGRAPTEVIPRAG